MNDTKKTIWQTIKFSLVSSVVTILQIVLVNVFLYFMSGWKAELPALLKVIFNEATVGAGNDNWGYVLPFFLSNFIANLYGWFQNRKTTFHADTPAINIVYYFIVLTVLILFSTWFQGRIVYLLSATPLSTLGPTIAALLAGLVQFAVLFPLEKFVLLKEK